MTNLHLSGDSGEDTLGPLPGASMWGSSDGEFPLAAHDFFTKGPTQPPSVSSNKSSSPSPGMTSCRERVVAANNKKFGTLDYIYTLFPIRHQGFCLGVAAEWRVLWQQLCWVPAVFSSQPHPSTPFPILRSTRLCSRGSAHQKRFPRQQHKH